MNPLNFQEVMARPDKLLRVHLSLVTNNFRPNEVAQRGQPYTLNTISRRKHTPCVVELPQIFSAAVYQIVFQTWCVTGHGNHSMESVTEDGKVKVVLLAGTSYIDYVPKEKLHEIRQFRSTLQSHIQELARGASSP